MTHVLDPPLTRLSSLLVGSFHYFKHGVYPNPYIQNQHFWKRHNDEFKIKLYKVLFSLYINAQTKQRDKDTSSTPWAARTNLL